MKSFILLIFLSTSLSLWAASEKGKVYVNSFPIEGQTIVVKGDAAKLLYQDIEAFHEVESDFVSIRQSRTVVCQKRKKNRFLGIIGKKERYQCRIVVDDSTGEVREQPLTHALEL